MTISFPSRDFRSDSQESQKAIEELPILHSGFHRPLDQSFMNRDTNGDPQAFVPRTMFELALTKLKVRQQKTRLSCSAVSFRWQDGDPVGFLIIETLECPSPASVPFHPKVNAHFKTLFDVRSSLLSSPEPRYVLGTHEGGWFGSYAMPCFTKTYMYASPRSHTMDLSPGMASSSASFGQGGYLSQPERR